MIINNVKFDIDFTDADFVERLEKAREIAAKESEETKNKNLTTAEGIRHECKIAKNFLDYVLGEGTSQKLFGEKNSLNQCIKALEELDKAIENQEKDMNSRIAKYSPTRLNR